MTELEEMKIFAINILSAKCVVNISVGDNVKAILDKSFEYPNGIHSEYWIINHNDKCVRILQNLPLDILYSKEENLKDK